jgi:hypothetical protein
MLLSYPLRHRDDNLKSGSAGRSSPCTPVSLGPNELGFKCHEKQQILIFLLDIPIRPPPLPRVN